ncbi:MFS general substrate transporter [Dendrothele bispora CBS 962.96]|uniref:MFS general substrate transporter n=1 Tax=Dendrothele bispora (strain CBS 962.96) TaxID=1314807 RepID=A0A4V4HF01_DENBC|nr:MFS general substrate transporter [Dendrothele bispora CBS 962.96]
MHSRKTIIHLATLFWLMFLAGWNDGSTGPLLPRIQEVYDVNYLIVSLIFIFACVGFISGAIVNVPLSWRLGFGKVVVIGSVLQQIAYAIQSPALPFPAFVMSFTINGIGLAVQDAQANGYTASMRDNTETRMGMLHAAYGVGALCAPLVATQFSTIPRWSFYYFCSLGVATINTIVLSVVFRFRTQDECLAEMENDGLESKSASVTDSEKGTVDTPNPTQITQSENPSNTEREVQSHRTSLFEILSNKYVNILAFFIFVYVGVEVTIGGWIVTYIIDVRGGGTGSGYIATGYWAGLTLGRVLLLPVNKMVGEQRVMFLYLGISIVLVLLIWLVPSLILSGVLISIIGFLIGPCYPITMNAAGRVIPKNMLTGSIGWIAGFGQAGSAVFPFITGAIGERWGIVRLMPLLLAMMIVTMILWALVPGPGRMSRRLEQREESRSDSEQPQISEVIRGSPEDPEPKDPVEHGIQENVRSN